MKWFGGLRTDYRRLDHYERQLAPYRTTWSEAPLTATLRVLHRLGVTGVFLHSPRSGAGYKNIRGRTPPRSLYSDLPRRFAFEPDVKAPAFIDGARARDRAWPRGVRMWRLDLRPLRPRPVTSITARATALHERSLPAHARMSALVAGLRAR